MPKGTTNRLDRLAALEERIAGPPNWVELRDEALLTELRKGRTYRNDPQRPVMEVDLRRLRSHALQLATAVQQRADTETRDLTQDETRDADRLLDFAELLNEEIEARSERCRRGLTDEEADELRASGRMLFEWDGDEEMRDEASDRGATNVRYEPARSASRQTQRTARPILFRDDQGKEIRAYRRGENLRDDTRGDLVDRNCDLGRALVAYATGNYRQADNELRAMSTGKESAGGYLLNPSLSAQVIDLARNESVLMQAGALTLPMPAKEVVIAGIAQDPTATWRREGAPAVSSEPLFNVIRLSAHSLVAMVPLTLEMVEDASNAPGLVENAIMQSLALELDRAGLRGSGGAEPMGVRNFPNVNEIVAVGAPNYDNLIDAMHDVESANGVARTWIRSPREAATYRKLKDSQLNYLTPPPDVAALQKLTTNQIPTNLGGGANESEMYVGDFSQVIVGVRKSVTITVHHEGTDGTHNAMSELKLFIRAYLRADVAVVRPNHIARLLGVTT